MVATAAKKCSDVCEIHLMRDVETILLHLLRDVVATPAKKCSDVCELHLPRDIETSWLHLVGHVRCAHAFTSVLRWRGCSWGPALSWVVFVDFAQT